MSKRTTWVVAVVTVLAVGIGGGAVTALVVGGGDGDGRDPDQSIGRTSSEDVGPAPAGLEEFYTQQLEWSPCGSNECARLTVPVDYDEPDGRTVELYVERVPAADQDSRVGSIVVNPGGPGAPGSTLVENPEAVFGAPLLKRADIVAFDPRGTGRSAPVDCLSDSETDEFVAMDPAPDDPGEIAELAEAQEDFFDGCVENSGPLIGHVSTVEAARDMDVLRAALGERRLSYLGFSYGTTLGARYAELFPDNVGRFVLDGATDPSLGFRQNSLSQAGGFQTALNAYVENCLSGGDCFLGSSRQEALGTIDSLLQQIDDQPLPTSLGRDLEVGNAFYGVVTPLYSRQSWPVLDQALQQALQGQGDILLRLSDLYASREPDGSYSDNSIEAFLAINCLDDPSAIQPEDVPQEYRAFQQVSPTFGEVFAWGLAGCHGLEVEPTEPTPKIRAEGAAPIVVVGTTRDPATPYEEAVALADQLASGVLLTREGDGHTAYNKGNACIDDAIEGYLLEGDVPEDGKRC